MNYQPKDTPPLEIGIDFVVNDKHYLIPDKMLRIITFCNNELIFEYAHARVIVEGESLYILFLVAQKNNLKLLCTTGSAIDKASSSKFKDADRSGVKINDITITFADNRIVTSKKTQ